MKKTILLTLLAGSLFAGDVVKLTTNEIPLTKDISGKEMDLYSLKPEIAFENNKFQSCIIQDNKRLNEINLLCNRNSETLFTKINGVINPDSKLYVYETYLKLKDFNKEVEKLKQGE